jgi:hypothetical protein
MGLDISYRYSYGLKSGRAYIYTVFEFSQQTTTHICFNMIPQAVSLLKKSTRQIRRFHIVEPLTLHIILTSETLEAWYKDGSEVRKLLVHEVSTRSKFGYLSNLTKERNSYTKRNPKLTTQVLHGMSQKFTTILEDMRDLEQRMLFLADALGTFSKTTNDISGSTEAEEKLSYLLSKCRTGMRWISTYVDRVSLRISLVNLLHFSFFGSRFVVMLNLCRHYTSQHKLTTISTSRYQIRRQQSHEMPSATAHL